MQQRAAQARPGVRALALALVLAAAGPARGQNTTGNLNGNFNTYGDFNGNTNGGDSQARGALGSTFHQRCPFFLSALSARTPRSAPWKLPLAVVPSGVPAPGQAAARAALLWASLTLVWVLLWPGGQRLGQLRLRGRGAALRSPSTPIGSAPAACARRLFAWTVRLQSPSQGLPHSRHAGGDHAAAMLACLTVHTALQDSSYQGGTAYSDASGNTIVTPNTVGNGNGNFNTNSSNNGNFNGNNGQARLK